METIKLSIEKPVGEYNALKRMEYELVQDADLRDMLELFRSILITMGYSISDKEQLEITNSDVDEPNKEVIDAKDS